MSELPKGWGRARVSDVARLIRGVSYKKQDSRTEAATGLLPVLRANNIDGELNFDDLVYVPANRVSEEQRIRKGDIVIAMSSGSKRLVGKAAQAMADFEGGFGAFCGLVRPSDSLEPRYLGYFFQSEDYRKAVSEASAGVNINNLKRDSIESLHLPVAPLSEQRRIVARIEELFSRLDAGVAALRHAKAQLQRYRQSVLAAAVTGQLTQAWREQHPETEPASELLKRILDQRREHWICRGKYNDPENPDVSKMPGIPTSWKWARLDAVCAIGSGMSVSKNRKHKNPVEVPYLRVANVQRGRLVLDEVKRMEIERDRLPDLSLKTGDVLFNEGGDRDKLGRGWVWDGQIDPCITQNHVFRASPFDLEALLPKFLSHWGNTFGQQFFLDEGTQTTNLASINKGVLSSFPVPVPPIDEQRQIVAEVEARTTAIDHLEAELDRQIIRSNRLRQSTLAASFSGQL